MSRLDDLQSLGQSIWYDNIQRSMLENGEMAGMIHRGEIRGVTSNPSIFNQAITMSHDYDAALKPLAWAGWSAEKIFWQLAFEDIRAAADLFRSLYEKSNGGDGYVSLEVNPLFAHDTAATLYEAQHLWDKVCRPNLMIKIPATPEGIPAVRSALALGINVNVTLIFSLSRYREVMDAYLSGLEDRLKSGGSVLRLMSVASFFISRVDSKVDLLLNSLQTKGVCEAECLKGLAAIANARMAYSLFLKTFASKRYLDLELKGARVQRPLWASTSTKNSLYRDTIYIEELIGQNTVNTIPPQTLVALKEHGNIETRITHDIAGARATIASLENLGILMKRVTNELEEEGVKSFADAFSSLMKNLEIRRKEAISELGDLSDAVSTRIKSLDADHVMERIFQADGSLWTSDQAGIDEIRRRLGWLHAPRLNLALVSDFHDFAAEIIKDGFTHVLILGMGGSSLAPEVYQQTLRKNKNSLELAILDSTHPEQVLEAGNRFPIGKTLFIISSKSGETAEVNAFLGFFWERELSLLEEKTGSHFIAITDAGTPLELLAKQRGFRKVFFGDTSVGGRYSALTPYGLVPFALLGGDVQNLLMNANRMAMQCTPEVPSERNPGLVLGAALGEACLRGRDKLMIMADLQFASFGSWLEQLIAESSGKQGLGMVPVDSEPFTITGSRGEDRIYIYLRSDGTHDSQIELLKRNNQPVLIFPVKSPEELGGEFYRWEIATAILCAILHVNGFNQPDVQFNKALTLKMLEEYRKIGKWQENKPVWKSPTADIFAESSEWIESANDIEAVIQRFLSNREFGDYIAINAYLPRNTAYINALQSLQKFIVEKTGCAVTLGFGPRFLHSTGQLHKGGPNTGLFLLLTDLIEEDILIPGQGISFGSMLKAQALGDYSALIERGRRVIRIDLKRSKIADFISDLHNLYSG